MTRDEIKHVFTYHSPDPAAIRSHEDIRTGMMDVTEFIAMELLPDSTERTRFVWAMQEAQMLAHATIALHGRRPPEQQS